jgi:excisionase family DNA binding protein
MTVAQAARYVGIGEKALRREIAKGVLKSRAVGDKGQRVITRSQLEAWASADADIAKSVIESWPYKRLELLLLGHGLSVEWDGNRPTLLGAPDLETLQERERKARNAERIGVFLLQFMIDRGLTTREEVSAEFRAWRA